MLSPSPCFWQPGMRNLIPLEAGAARRSSEFGAGMQSWDSSTSRWGHRQHSSSSCWFSSGPFSPKFRGGSGSRVRSEEQTHRGICSSKDGPRNDVRASDLLLMSL